MYLLIFQVPEIDRQFLRDQRNKIGPHGKLQIGSIDRVEARRAERCEKRKQDEEEGLRKMKKRQLQEKEKETFQYDEQVDIGSDDDNDIASDDNIFIPIDEEKVKELKQNRLKLTNFARECDRYGVPDRQAAALANALLVDIGFVEPTGESKNVIDKNKVRRERDRARGECKKNKSVETKGGIRCFGFDGKRDKKTLIQRVSVEDGEEKFVQERGMEEHISYTAEGEYGGTYLTHSTIPAHCGTGSDLAEDFKDVIMACGSENCVEAIVCDGTNVRRTFLLCTILKSVNTFLV